MNYFTEICLNLIMTLIAMATIANSNKNLSKRARIVFLLVFTVLAFGIVDDLIAEKFFRYKTSIQIIKFIILPVVPIIMGNNIFAKNIGDKYSTGYKALKIYFIIEELLMISSIFFYKINFVYNSLIYLYYLSFTISTVYLFIKALKFSKFFQNKKMNELIFIIVFLILGILIQLLNQNIKIPWLPITLTSIFIYNYFNGLVHCIDGLTMLLNQKNFDVDMRKTNKQTILIIFDVNDFKIINDTYGHNFGDSILATISEILKQTYHQYGNCYRIGGDEFSVIIEKRLSLQQVDQLNKLFIERLNEKRNGINELPSISHGMCEYDPKKMSADEAFKKADINMYANKKKQKEESKK